VNLTRINLAATLSDGQVLFVPNGEEEVPENYPLPGQPNATSSETGGGQIAGTALINLNVATVSDLTTLPGIGEKRAQDILQHRDSNGGFKTVTDLKDVSGIGEKTFEKLAPLVTVG
jgi:competence protein ComEA